MKIYLAGPMRGYKLFNFPAFDCAAENLRALGHVVVNPADFDREKGNDPLLLPADWDWNVIPPDLDIREVIRHDIEVLTTCDAIALLNGWKYSAGATAEFYVANWLGLQVFGEGF